MYNMKFGSILKCFLPAVLLAGALNVHSQNFRFGIQANPGINWVAPDNTELFGDGVRFTFDFGLVMEYLFGDGERYAFNTGMNILVSGANVKGLNPLTSDNILESHLTAKVTYLEIPTTIKLRSNQIGYFNFYGQLGVATAFAVRSRADYSVERSDGSGGVITTTVKNSKFDDIPVYPTTIEKVKPVNFGLYTEAGMEYAISENTSLVTGLFFNTGFLDMFKDNDGDRVVSRNMGLRVGVLF